jgi:hypothetical protein
MKITYLLKSQLNFRACFKRLQKNGSNTCRKLSAEPFDGVPPACPRAPPAPGAPEMPGMGKAAEKSNTVYARRAKR